MVTCLRPALGVLAAVALLALGVLSMVTSDTAPIADRHDVVAVAKASAARPAAPARAPRPAAVPLLVVAALVAVAATVWARTPALIGRQGRRPGDDGDDWRSLLLGAPPGLA